MRERVLKENDDLGIKSFAQKQTQTVTVFQEPLHQDNNLRI